METDENILKLKRQKKGKSRVTNGAKLLPMTDGRSATARRFKDLLQDYHGDLGGIEIMSTGEQQLAKRAAFLSAELERLEAMAIRGERLGAVAWREEKESAFDLERYSIACSLLARVLNQLGLQRRQKPVNELSLRDISEQMAVKAPEKPAASQPNGQGSCMIT
jgi:hypothetical protein